MARHSTRRCCRSPRAWRTRASAPCPVRRLPADLRTTGQRRYGQPVGAPQNAAAVLHGGEVVLSFA
ncbi:hypothetical protein CLM85_33380, partial [Streptomyces albidoflavus]|uniref:hypothetical protein n=1 Tax=Streptomyces albidoflavus TaxID=1886 RepID=UPI000BC9A444